MKIYVVTYDLIVDTVEIKVTQENVFLGIAQSLLEAKNVVERNVPNGYRNIWPSDGWTFNYESCYDNSKRAYRIREITLYEDLKKIETLETEVSNLKNKIKELKSRLNALHRFDSGSKYTTKSFKEDSEHVEF